MTLAGQAPPAPGPMGCFSASRGAALSIATGAEIVWDTEDFDYSNWFDTSTGRFTPQVAGYYRITTTVSLSLSASGKFHTAGIRKNGSTYKEGNIVVASAAGSYVSIATCVVYLNGSTDYVSVFDTHNDTGSRAINVLAGISHFEGELIGRG